MNKFFERTITNKLNELSTNFPVVLVTGPRQVGKTTLLNDFIDSNNGKISLVTLDNLKDRALAQENPELFLRTYEPPVVIDEFQYAPQLLPYIKIKIDKMRYQSLKNNTNPNGQYYLTGSQIFQTMEQVGESLAGRVGILNLYNLSEREIEKVYENKFSPKLEELKNKKTTKKYQTIKLFDRILKGGYPELWRNPKLNRNDFFNEYIKTYIERDIRQLINLKDELKFIRFIQSVAARTGQVTNIDDISSDVGISNNTGNEWFSILVNTGLIILLQPYYNNNLSRIIKSSKLYMTDTGLACYLTGYMDATVLERSMYNGAIFETYVINEIVKSFTNQGLEPSKYLYYYRDKDKKEIDLLIEENKTIHPIEIKKSSTPDKDAIKNFDILKTTGYEIGEGGIICMAEKLMPIDEKNNIIPIEYI